MTKVSTDGSKVEVNGNLEKAMRTWKVKVARSGVPSALKNKKYYEKPGVKRKREEKEMKRNAKKHRNY